MRSAARSGASPRRLALLTLLLFAGQAFIGAAVASMHPPCGGEGQPRCEGTHTTPPPCGGPGQPACQPPAGTPPPCGGAGQPACQPTTDPKSPTPPPCGGAGQPECQPPAGSTPPPCGGANQPPCQPPQEGTQPGGNPPPGNHTMPPPGGAHGNHTMPPPGNHSAPPCGPERPCPPPGNHSAPPCGPERPCPPPGNHSAPPCGPEGACPNGHGCPPNATECSTPPPCPPNATDCQPPRMHCPPDAADCQRPPPCPPNATDCQPPPMHCPPDAADCQRPPPCPPNATDCQAPPSCPPDAPQCQPMPMHCPPNATRGCPPPGGPCGPAPGNASGPPCQPPCSPEKPCAPPRPAFCEEGTNGTLRCAPPPQCAQARDDPACAPPSFCRPEGDAYVCTPPMNAALPGGPCPANATAPCGPPAPPCSPGANGTLLCAPPAACGGAAFAGAGGQGCAPPDFCKPAPEGGYVCAPPQDCRRGPDGRETCVRASAGAACAAHMGDVAASGAFVPCAPALDQRCLPQAAGTAPGLNATSGCFTPPPPPRFCEAAPGVEPRGPGQEGGPGFGPIPCIPAPRIEGGRYLPPMEALAQGACGAQANQTRCPPPAFAPPPPSGEGFEAWRRFAGEKAPPAMLGAIERLGESWSRVNGTDLENVHRAGAVHNLFAPPVFDGRAIEGMFVSSRLDETLRLENFSVGGTSFFREARPHVQGNATFTTVAGPAVFAAAGEVVVETHNVPSGILAYKSAAQGNFSVDLRPEQGQRVTRQDGLLVMERDGWKGVLVGDANVTPEGGIRLDVAPGRPGFFMAVPPEGLEADTRLDIAKGVARGKVFAEMALVGRNGTLAHDLTVYEGGDAFRAEVLHAAADKVELKIGGEGEGKAIVFTVDRSTLATPLSRLNVTMDGELMRECRDFAAMTESAPEGGCYVLHANESVVRVSVMPPHFSEHVIAVGEVASEEEPTSEDPISEEPPQETPDEPEPVTPTPDATADAPPTTSTPAGPPAVTADTPGLGLAASLGVLALAGLALRRRRA